MNPWINYHHLYYFKAIAEEGSVSKAAEKLRIGQPTLSAQLKQFEDSIGVPLFERQHKKLFLTEQGKIALDYAKNIFKLGSEMYEVLHDRIRPQRPEVHIGAIDSISKQVIMELTKASLKISPCMIHLSEGKLDELIRELTAHRMDILVTNYLPTALEAKGLVHRSIARNNISIYGAPKFKTLRKNFPQSISGQPMVLPTYDSRLRYDLDHWCATQKVEFDVVVESQDIAVKKLMAAEGIGLIPAASHTVTLQVQNGELIEIGSLTGVYEELLLVGAKRKVENPFAVKLLQTFSI